MPKSCTEKICNFPRQLHSFYSQVHSCKISLSPQTELGSKWFKASLNIYLSFRGCIFCGGCGWVIKLSVFCLDCFHQFAILLKRVETGSRTDADTQDTGGLLFHEGNFALLRRANQETEQKTKYRYRREQQLTENTLNQRPVTRTHKWDPEGRNFKWPHEFQHKKLTSWHVALFVYL